MTAYLLKPRLNWPRSLATATSLSVLLAVGASAQTTQHFKQTDLTSNLASMAPNRDANLVNPWGLSRSSEGAWWVSDNGTGLSTLYDGTGKTIPLVVSIPSAGSSSSTGSPTGTIFNGDSAAFQLAPGKAAIFLFATEDGTISGWNPGVKPTSAVVMVKNKGAVYKGLTSAVADSPFGPKTYLYAANFHSGEVEVYDSSFKRVNLVEGAFDEDHAPGFAPFNVQNIGGNIYVTYAKQGSDGLNETDGLGLGFVNVYSPTGRILHRLERGPWFNAPWGLALASGDFGAYSHDVLVGQFGSGEILVFDPITDKYKGKLKGADDKPIHNEGLWALSFGNGTGAGSAIALYFTAGINGEQNGLFGSITAVENVQGNDQ